MSTRIKATLALLIGMSGCAGTGQGPFAGGSPPNDDLDSYLGTYRGSFGSALTEDPADDLNFNPCDPEVERCLGQDAYLADILLSLHRDARGVVRLGFYRTMADLERERSLDLLGRGCGTEIGPLRATTRSSEDASIDVAHFPLSARSRLCLSKLRPTSSHEIKVEFGIDADSGIASAQVLIDKNLVSENYLYVKEKGVERRVRIDRDNTVGRPGEIRYRVCIQDDLGEYDRCVLTDRELKQVLLPVPLPGGAAVSYTWWYDLTPNLKRTRDLYRLEQYSGRFERIAP
ncbi:MAG: hypothetical protein R3E86_03705 [Pseudomonadales bacterium]